MRDNEAKKILKFSSHYYLRERGVIGTHWEEWKAVEHVLRKWERSESKLRHVRAGLVDLLDKWKEDARAGRGTTLGMSDRIQKLMKEIK